jgi:hypothetical protein
MAKCVAARFQKKGVNKMLASPEAEQAMNEIEQAMSVTT